MEEREEKAVKLGGSFIKQAAILALAGILSRALGFALRIPLTNTLGDEGIGIYGDGYVIYNFFFILSSAGLPSAISKLVAERTSAGRRDEAHKIFSTAMWCAVVLGALGMAALWFGADFFSRVIKNPRAVYTMMTLSPTVLIVAVMAVFRGYFQGVGTGAPTAVSQLVEQLFNLIFSLVFMFSFMNITLSVNNPLYGDKAALGAAGGQLGTGAGALAGLAMLAGLYALLRPTIHKTAAKAARKAKRLGQEVSTAAERVKAIFATAIPIIAGTAVFSFSNLVDSAMVKWRLISAGFSENAAVGLYGVYNGKYVTITTLPVAISAALAAAVIPSLAGSVATGDEKAVKNKAQLALKMSMLVAFPAAIGLGVLSDPIYRLIFPGAPDGSKLLFYGAGAVILLSLSQISAGVLQGANKIVVPVVAALCGVAVKIPLNYVLCGIPKLNIYGAIISTTACYLVSGGINLLYVSKLTGTKVDWIGSFVKPLICAVFMGMAAYAFYAAGIAVTGSNAVSVILGIAAGLCVYFYLLILVSGVSAREMRLIPSMGGISHILRKRGWLE